MVDCWTSQPRKRFLLMESNVMQSFSNFVQTSRKMLNILASLATHLLEKEAWYNYLQWLAQMFYLNLSTIRLNTENT